MDLDPNIPIELTLSLGKVNLVLSALSKAPYEQVAGLIAEIQQTASTQIVAKQQASQMAANLATAPASAATAAAEQPAQE